MTYQSEERRWGRSSRLPAGALIRRMREDAGLSLRDVCGQINMAVSQLSDIERGVQAISLRRIHQLASVLSGPFDEVLSLVLQEKLSEAGFADRQVSVHRVEQAAPAAVNGTSGPEQHDSAGNEDLPTP